MSRTYKLKKIFWALGAAITVVSFNNCGEGFTTLSSMAPPSGGSFEFSTADGSTCEQALVKVYANTFHPFLNQSCGGCHLAGGIGNGVFGSKEVLTSYNAFVSKGAALVSANAVNPNHQPPYTGPANQARVDEINQYWGAAQDKYAQCVADAGPVVQPSPTVTPMPTATVSSTPTVTPSPSPSVTPSPTATPSPTPTVTPTPTPTPTVTPTPSPTPATVTFTQLASSGGVFATSCFACHKAGSASAGLDLTNYSQAKAAASKIKSRMNNSSKPMPTSGLLPQAQRTLVDNWIAAGTPQ
ncbi:hypothetical protein ACLSU7_01095 [Bdellovibrio sp. HCB185ZH]|uniref:hypothetical protein n=1 Tax=Bdellovibrio sp. HCB185ZH TaxID=3394235 RepID=UPI0039A6BC53